MNQGPFKLQKFHIEEPRRYSLFLGSADRAKRTFDRGTAHGYTLRLWTCSIHKAKTIIYGIRMMTIGIAIIIMFVLEENQVLHKEASLMHESF